MLGSDYPFPVMDPRPREVVLRCGFDAATTEAILGGTACRLFAIG
jgi:hypothetical protein